MAEYMQGADYNSVGHQRNISAKMAEANLGTGLIRKAGLQSDLEGLHKAVAMLEATAENLINTLTPVIRQEEASRGVGLTGGSPEESGSPLTMQIRQLRNRVFQIERQLRDLVPRIDL